MSGIVGKNPSRGSGVVGATPVADESVDSDAYVDGSVDLAHLQTGTDGQIITWDASGDPVAVGPGSDGEVLTSTGAGSPPAFEAAGGGEDGLTNSSNTTWMTVSADEEVNMPLQPCFLAYRTSTASNVTGNGGAYTIPFDIEIFDIGSNYATTGIFTAPITGKYIFTSFFRLTGLASRNSIESQFVTSNRKHRMVTFNADELSATSIVAGGSCIADMDASDTCKINLQCWSSSDTVDVYGDGSNGYTYFSGCLLV